VAAINSVGIEPPREIVGTLSIVCDPILWQILEQH